MWRDKASGEFKYPIEKYPDVIIYYNREHPHQDVPKIVIPTTTYFRVMYYTINGTSQSMCYYNLKDNEDKDIVLNNINNKLKVGIVGFGAVGQKRRLYIDRNPSLITTAVCDVRFKKDGSMVDGSDFNYKYDLLENQSYENKNKIT